MVAYNHHMMSLLTPLLPQPANPKTTPTVIKSVMFTSYKLTYYSLSVKICGCFHSLMMPCFAENHHAPPGLSFPMAHLSCLFHHGDMGFLYLLLLLPQIDWFPSSSLRGRNAAECQSRSPIKTIWFAVQLSFYKNVCYLSLLPLKFSGS